MINDRLDDDVFGRRVAERLREPQHADPAFVERVMATVESAGVESLPGRSWWARPRTLRFTPIAALALAAGVALAAVGLTLTARDVVRRPIAAVSDTVYLVRFVLSDDAAESVALVGSFNDWMKNATPLRRSGSGVWTVTVALPHGRHEYAFVVRDRRGERWTADPAGLLRRDEFGTESSVVSVGSS